MAGIVVLFGGPALSRSHARSIDGVACLAVVLDPGLLALFLVTIFVICITPGPDMLFIIATSLSQGRIAGVVASLGMGIGMLVHSALVVIGLAAVFETSPLLYDIVRYAGAAYLIYLGIRAWIEGSGPRKLEGLAKVSLWTILRRATITNLLNPKIVLFYLAFLPQFVNPGRGSTTAQLAVLALLFVLMGLLVDAIIAVAAGQLGDWLRTRHSVEKILHRIAGTVFMVLAARLVLA